MITCQACGTENPEGATYCRKCATRLDVTTQERVVQRREAHVATAVRWPGVITTTVIILIILLVLLFVTHVL
jgi:uncharacterized membrane protein YvbJ